MLRVGDDDGILAALRGRLSEFAGGMSAAMGFAAPALPGTVPPEASLVVAQGLPDGSDSPVTLVAAADPEALREGVERITRPERWTAMAGGMATIRDGSDAVRTVDAARTRLVATAELDAGNLRLVTAAWLSAHSGVYAMLLLGAATLFGLATFAKVRRSGVRRP